MAQLRRVSHLPLMASFLLLLATPTTHAWVSVHPSVGRKTARTSTHTKLEAIPAAAASLLAGSVAGALGVGVAYPLDTIKTKAQVLAVSQTELTTSAVAESNDSDSSDDQEKPLVDFGLSEIETLESDISSASSSKATATTKPLVDFSTSTPDNTMNYKLDPSTGTVLATAPIPLPAPGASMMEVASYLYKTGGIGAFFGGVQTSMLGQAIIKAVVFAVNAGVLEYSREHHLFHDDTAMQLLSAAALAGFVTSFLAAPVDRIKVLMQCSDHECYHGDEGECVEAVLEQEGWKGLLGRGLGCTMVREIPAYSLYFGVYGGLQAVGGDFVSLVGPTMASALFGATAGCACWLPIYPIDVIRTVALNTEGSDDMNLSGATATTSSNKSTWEIAKDLYEAGGWEAFYDGLGARLLRQAVNHAVTFSVYEMLMKVALYQQQPDLFG